MANILLVENDPILAGLIRSTLGIEGHQISEAANSRTALELLRQSQSSFDLILTEVGLGTELAKVLSRQRRDTKIMFMTDYVSVVDAIYSLLDGVSVLEKPFTANKLRRTVHDALARAAKRKPGPQRPGHRATPAYQPVE